MKKFLNKPENFVDEMIEGIIAAHPDQLACVENDLRCVVKAGEKKQGKVGLATGGGGCSCRVGAGLGSRGAWLSLGSLVAAAFVRRRRRRRRAADPEPSCRAGGLR